MTYLEIEQDDLTDSEMLDVIREKMADGWALGDYKYDQGVKTWVFEKEETEEAMKVRFMRDYGAYGV